MDDVVRQYVRSSDGLSRESDKDSWNAGSISKIPLRDGDDYTSMSLSSSIDSSKHVTGNTTPTGSSNGIFSSALPIYSHALTANHVFLTAQRLGTNPPKDGEIFDMICVGFGPASLAVAIALAEKCTTTNYWLPRVLFVEKQDKFAWHAGMQIADAKMQISFLKDLATPRNPTSPFTFINYLHIKERLHQFINLGTFLPSRKEYEDYMGWCAGFFSNAVSYGCDVTKVDYDFTGTGRVQSFKVHWKNQASETNYAIARHVIIAAGGKPFVPPELNQLCPAVKHSSEYTSAITAPYSGDKNQHFVVVGNGQSAAEIFNDLWSRYPAAKVTLIIKCTALRPSDDSPFVNEIFDPDRVDSIYEQDATERLAAIKLDRGTNYGVVRLSLLEHIYEKLYMQRLHEPDESKWRCKILTNRTIVSAISSPSTSGSIILSLAPTNDLLAGRTLPPSSAAEEVTASFVFAATGYVRNAHEELLKDTRDLLPRKASGERGAGFPVGRNYRVLYDAKKVDEDSGVWLQGCNESTHGLSDTLLSILAVRGGEMVNSVFGGRDKA